MTAYTSVEAFAPATVANLGIGFDVLGMAIEGSGDRIQAEWHDGTGAIVKAITGDGGRLPHDPNKNVATIAANALLHTLGERRGVALTIHKGLPLASGLGSSSASAVAAAVAVNGLLGEPLNKADLLPATLEGEAAVSGYHADNVAPCLFGGITLVTGLTAAEIRVLPAPSGLFFAFVTPDVAVPTAEARAVLPKQVSLKQMIHQTAYVAALVDALYRGDVPAIARAMVADEVVEPARQRLMPYLTEVRAAALEAGALGLVISGAGPTLCAICPSESAARAAEAAMQAVYDGVGMVNITRCAQVLHTGAIITQRA